MTRTPLRPSWIRWQVGVWAWGEPAFLAHMDKFWQGQVVGKAPAHYNPQTPANGWSPIDMVPLDGEWGDVPQRAYGLTAVRQDEDRIFFNGLADVLEKRAEWDTFDAPTNLICMMGTVTEKPEQYGNPATDVGVEPPKPGIVLLSPHGRANGKDVGVIRSLIRYIERTRADIDVYSTTTAAALTRIWLEEFNPPRPLLEHWRRGCREQALGNALPPEVTAKPRPRF